jgi:hypothetical protein
MDSDILSEAIEKFSLGALKEAESLCRAGLQKSPRDIKLTILLGDILAQLNRPDDALAAYTRADRLKPGMPVVFTRSATLAFRSAFGGPPAPRSLEGARPRIQMTRLGITGRFGNQLLQYAFVRFYAQQHGLTAEVPDWIGRDLFDLDDPLPSVALSKVDESELDFFESLNGRAGPILLERDVTGYFCGSTALWGARADAFRALFAPGHKIRPLLDRAWTRLADAGRTIVAIHLRRSDFGYAGFWIAPVDWYLTWLRRIWPDLHDPVLYVATDTRALVPSFAEFPCWDASKLGVDIPGAEFMVDHHILSKADHVAISNSTFSFTAAMLNTRANSFVRPHPNRRELIPFEPWSADVLLGAVVGSHEVPVAERLFLQHRFRVTGSVIHLGEYCAAWTFLARKRYPELRVAELGSGTGVDRFREKVGLGHIGLLVVGDRDALPQVLESARHTLSHSRIDTLHFRVGPKQEGAAATLELAGYGYGIFRLTEEAPVRVEPDAPLDEGSYVAVHERLVPGFLGGSASDP